MTPLRRLSLRVNPFHALRLWLERRLFEDPGLRAVIVNSDMVRGEILSRFRIDPARIVTIANGVDLNRFHPSRREREGLDLRRRMGVRDEELVILFVGSGFDRKGLELAIHGMAEAAVPARLWVVGKGGSRRYKGLARELGLEARVDFWGPQRDTAPFYAAADVFLLPTLYDPFPSVILEAMASGLPVVTTAQCGAAEIIVPGREGFILDYPEQTGRISRYLEALGAREERLRMGREARVRAEDFPWERTVKELEELYDHLMSERF
jgi:UDP-glucose:(heptosyl)LPS alpha-1,3-glucosyltransferase